MKILRDISEDEFIATFLKYEITSKRFGERITKQLNIDNKDTYIITNPDLNNTKDNEYRKTMLGICRGYNKNLDIFEGFPQDIVWKQVLLTKEELRDIKYIDYDYWIELSKGTRSPADAAKTIKEGVEVFRISNDRYFNAVEHFKNGGTFGPLIFVCNSKKDKLVLLEGHLRTTTYFLEPDLIPQEIECIMGVSDNIEKWSLY